MKILHTSDWHLGKQLYSMSRHEEHRQFLDHLCRVLQDEAIDVLVVCGDVFDNQTPSHRSQSLYYSFLSRLASLPALRDVVIIAGNHDSPSFLAASRPLLEQLQIHVICSGDDPDQELLTLRDKDGIPYLIVAAVPYLRDRDVRTAVFGESDAERVRSFQQGVCEHYRQLATRALNAAQSGGRRLPIIATGHLFAAGCRVLSASPGQSAVLGALDVVPVTAFAPCFAYTALGHLHGAQSVAGRDNVRYCGSPLRLSFGERQSAKKLLMVELSELADNAEPSPSHIIIRELNLPEFQELAMLEGDASAILAGLGRLTASERPIWVEINYTSDAPPAELAEQVQELTEHSLVRVLALRIRQHLPPGLTAEHALQLASLQPDDVFARFLEDNHVPESERAAYLETFNQLLEISSADPEHPDS